MVEVAKWRRREDFPLPGGPVRRMGEVEPVVVRVREERLERVVGVFMYFVFGGGGVEFFLVGFFFVRRRVRIPWACISWVF